MISGLDFEDGVHSSPLTLVHHWHCCTVILFFYVLPSGMCSSCYSIAALSFSSLIPYHLVSFHRVTALLRCHSGFCSLQSGICSSCWSIAALSFSSLIPSIWNLFIVLHHYSTVILFLYSLPFGIYSESYSIAALS